MEKEYYNKPKEEILRKKKVKIKIPNDKICEMCGINKATDRHHPDYYKPLEIQFICHQCNCKLERIEICH